MKTILAATLLTLLSLTATAKADNIYKEGTLGFKLYEQIAAVLPNEVTPVFILASDKMFFMKQIDTTKLGNTPVTIDSLAYAMKAVKPEVVKNSRAHVIGDSKIPGNEKAGYVCPMVFSELKYTASLRTVFHEAMHCKTNFNAQSFDFRRALSPAYYATSGISVSQFTGLFDEALAAALQVAYAYNNGLTDGLEMVKEAASMSAQGHHSFGPNFSRHFLKLCGKKGACPTDTMAMLKKLTGDQKTMSLIVGDIVAKNSFMKSKGIYIADAK